MHGSCAITRMAGTYREDYVSGGGTRYFHDDEWSALSITIIIDQHTGCSGGCARKTPRLGGAVGRVMPTSFQGVGAGDFL